MSSRSRNGCIDCKKAKVKCDEVHPFCGTCRRRRRQCSGYIQPIKPSRPVSGPSSPRTPTTSVRQLTDHATSPDRRLSEPQPFVPPALYAGAFSPGPGSLGSPLSPVAFNSTPSIDLPLLKSIPTIPAGTINPADETFIEMYFLRHPKELVFGPEFVEEMNSSVIKVLQDSPLAVGDILSAIGEAYCKDSALPLVLPVASRRARILARLRGMDKHGVSMELLLSIMLGLCAVELVDSSAQRQTSSLPVLLDNLSMMLHRHLGKGDDLNQLAKYFLRAMARQDMLISLTRMHRSKIPTTWWLDDGAKARADRFMGYTGTLMPILSRLSDLAADIRVSWLETPRHSVEGNLHARASNLQYELSMWHPIVDPKLPFQSSRKFLMHANSYRQASLLYLFRLFSPPGSSAEADRAALTMAYEVMSHIADHEEDLKMSLWPVFLAACEMCSESDRLSVTNVLDSICRSRKTVTALGTRSFVLNRVWVARDAGIDWSWMTLNVKYPNELLPI
ncbi:hypothetical protein PV08_10164 [Exophiala spinifera]|uniref:Zn(2)-C6 fungal-type domain-containing protein n=1 Tax=Exophiala spinifera TaxID=91928 RepID=A0A0D2AWK5_9EURO|nr:uncharacterized protein PV08_10164 [Exophiala spinifera]KIW10865.1 hypothetical protein PV08_10164 [Exophiala spinifera]